MLKSIIYIVVVNQERLISAVPHLYYHRRLFYRLYFTVSKNPFQMNPKRVFYNHEFVKSF